jgi:3D (Asp-Asp-Asp) domain-containing protein
MFPPAIHQLDG